MDISDGASDGTATYIDPAYCSRDTEFYLEVRDYCPVTVSANVERVLGGPGPGQDGRRPASPTDRCVGFVHIEENGPAVGECSCPDVQVNPQLLRVTVVVNSAGVLARADTFSAMIPC